MPRTIKKRLSLRFELAHAMRVAALNIDNAEHRRIAVTNAQRIAKSVPEKYGTGWGALASLGRGLMLQLQATPKEQFADIATTLRQCAHAVEHGLRTVSETSIYDKRRRYGSQRGRP